MLAFLLAILKLIGIVLLILLIITLLAALVFLFSPINYWVSGAKDSSGLKYYIYVTWLFNLFKLSFDERGLKWQLLWLNNKNEHEREEVYEALDDIGESVAEAADAVEKVVVEEGEKSSTNLESDDAEKSDKPQTDRKSTEKTKQKKRKDRKGKPSKKASDEDEPSIFKRIKSVWNHPDRNEIWMHTKALIKKLVKQLKPRKFHLEAVFGFDNPADTGFALAAIYAVLGACGLSGDIEGDFLEERLEFAVDIEGRTNLWLLLWPIVIYILKKPIWKIVKKTFFGKDDLDERAI